MPAGWCPREDNAITFRKRLDSLAERRHYAGSFVSEDGWEDDAFAAIDRVQVAAADTAGFHTNTHFAGTGIGEVYFLDA